MTQKHTPGPWKVHFRRDGSAYICMGGLLPGQAHKQFDLLLEKDNGNDEVDAHLIAAAPDLLAALEFIIENGDGYDAREMARNAIARAKGGGQ